LEAKGFKDFGAPNLGGSIVTAGGLVFIAATNDHMFRAFDSKTGKLLWKAELEATGNATPSTYMGNNGKQYVVINGASRKHERLCRGRQGIGHDRRLQLAVNQVQSRKP
jgi:glucose dehydrogenase